MKQIQSIYLYLVFVIALIALTLFFVVFPTAEAIKENKKALAQKQQLLTSQEEEIASLRYARKNSEELTEKINKINNLWPKDKEISNFIVELENMANKENVTLKNIAISEATTASKGKKKRSEIQFSFDTKADFNQNMNIIKSLEKFSRFNLVKQLNFSNNEDSVSMKLTGYIYYGE